MDHEALTKIYLKALKHLRTSLEATFKHKNFARLFYIQ